MRHRTSSRWCEKSGACGRTSPRDQVIAAYGGFTRIDLKGSHDRGELDTCYAKQIRRTRTTPGFLLHQIFRDGFRGCARTSEDNAARGEGAEYYASAWRLGGVHGHNTPTFRLRSWSLAARKLPNQVVSNSEITNGNIDEIYDLEPSSGALGETAGGRGGTYLCCSWYRRSGIGRQG